jgi:bifunctional non-homologous end joining protein LigD
VKGAPADLLHDAGDGIAFNKHFTGDGMAIFKHACALGCEGIVSKRLGSAYRTGRVDYWLKTKNPAAPAVFVLALVIPGSLVILLVALLWTGR